MSLAEIRTRADRFQTRIRWRNWIEYAAAAFIVVAFGRIAVTAPAPAIQAGAVLIIAGALYVCWKLYALGRAATNAERDNTASLTDFHRAELVRQRAALATVWRWYLAPFAPGMTVFLAGVAFVPELEAPLIARIAVFALGAALVGLMFGFVAWINALAVKKLDAEIAALDRTA